MTRCRRAARGADEGRGPGRTWQQVGEAAHGALQLRGGGRVPPHVLLVALAQLPQPLHRAAGRGRRRRRRHASARPRASGRRRTAHARPAPLCAADGRRGGGLKARRRRRRRHGRCGARCATVGWAGRCGREGARRGTEGSGVRRTACRRAPADPFRSSRAREGGFPLGAVPGERLGSPVFGHLSGARLRRRQAAQQQPVLLRLGSAGSGCRGAEESCPRVCTARTEVRQPRVPLLLRVPALGGAGGLLRATPRPHGEAVRDTAWLRSGYGLCCA